jgi:hypothetical protein
MSNLFSRLFKTTPPADPKIAHYLKKQPLFSRTPETILAHMSRQVKMRSLDKGDILLRQDQIGPYGYCPTFHRGAGD